MIVLIRIFILALLSLSFLVILGQIDFVQVKAKQQQPVITMHNNNCTKYNVIQRSIIISCKSATLTDVYNQINNPNILNKQPQGVWLLNANMTIQQEHL